ELSRHGRILVERLVGEVADLPQAGEVCAQRQVSVRRVLPPMDRERLMEKVVEGDPPRPQRDHQRERRTNPADRHQPPPWAARIAAADRRTSLSVVLQLLTEMRISARPR